MRIEDKTYAFATFWTGGINVLNAYLYPNQKPFDILCGNLGMLIAVICMVSFYTYRDRNDS